MSCSLGFFWIKLCLYAYTNKFVCPIPTPGIFRSLCYLFSLSLSGKRMHTPSWKWIRTVSKCVRRPEYQQLSKINGDLSIFLHFFLSPAEQSLKQQICWRKKPVNFCFLVIFPQLSLFPCPAQRSVQYAIFKMNPNSLQKYLFQNDALRSLSLSHVILRTKIHFSIFFPRRKAFKNGGLAKNKTRQISDNKQGFFMSTDGIQTHDLAHHGGWNVSLFGLILNFLGLY